MLLQNFTSVFIPEDDRGRGGKGGEDVPARRDQAPEDGDRSTGPPLRLLPRDPADRPVLRTKVIQPVQLQEGGIRGHTVQTQRTPAEQTARGTEA